MPIASDNRFPKIVFDGQASTPSNPASGDYKLYFKDDAKLYKLDSAGVETEVGASTGGRTLISSQTPTGTGTCTFSSISNGYNKLTLEFSVRCSTVAASVYGYLRFNDDATAGNYGYAENYTSSGANGTNAAKDSLIFTTGINADSSPANCFTTGIIEIIHYANTNFYKTANYKGTHKRDNSTLNPISYTASTYWMSTSAISKIEFYLQSGNFMTNSVLKLYGEQ